MGYHHEKFIKNFARCNAALCLDEELEIRAGLINK